MKTHEEAVKEFEHNIKALKERGCVILSYSWFDDTHYHINFETPEDIKRRKEWEKEVKKKIKAREQVKQNVRDILALDSSQLDQIYFPNKVEGNVVVELKGKSNE